jgi:hypothetical protein
MDAISRHRATEMNWIALTLALLLVGFVIVAWEWHNAHTGAALHASNAAHHHRSQSNVPHVTPVEKHP